MQKYLVCERTGEKEKGLEKLLLSLYKDGVRHERLPVVSGSPHRQRFRTAEDPTALSGSLEPIPEGKYQLGLLEWAGKPWSLTVQWSTALGPGWISIIPTVPMLRGDFGIHLDGNASYAPGSAGCIVSDWVTMKRIFRWWEGTPPTHLYVDHGLGYVSLPGQPPRKAPDQVDVYLDGALVGAGKLVDGRAFAPVRDLADALELAVKWNPADRTVHYVRALSPN